MKVATFNVNSLRARVDIVARWLDQNSPDILCLQETKVQDADFPHAAIEATGYRYIFRGQKSYNGVAILSRLPLEDVEYGFDTDPPDDTRFLKAVINGITIINSYVPQGYSPESEQFINKLRWFERMDEYLRRRFSPQQPLIWLGDLNIAPKPQDLHDPQHLLGSVCFHPEVHKRLKTIMSWGLTDLFRLHNHQPGQYSFWDYRVPNGLPRNIGWRLDLILATAPVAAACRACTIDKAPRLLPRPSDHTPVVAELDWPPASLQS